MAFGNLNRDRVRSLPLTQIMVNPAQPRSRFEEESLQQLADSIAANGLLQPITVRETEPGRYQLVAGERRWRACMKLGMSHIPAIVKSCSLQESAVLALIENIHRQDLDLFDQAQGIASLIRYWGVTQEEAANRLGIAQSTLANRLRLLKLSPAIQQVMREGSLTERHGRALLRLPQEPQQLQAAKVMVQKEMTVAQAEKYVEDLLKTSARPKPTRLFICKDLRLFLNTVDKAVQTMKSAGLAIQTRQADEGDFICLTLRIPKSAQNSRPA